MEKLFKEKPFKEKRPVLILWVFFYFFIFTLLLKGSFTYLDPDLGWHLKVGEEIAQTGAVPSINYYNYTFTGNWVDHEWLSNYLVYEIYSHFGYIALSVIFALLIVGVLIILNIWSKRLTPKAPPLFIVFFQLFGVLASSPHFGVRIQECGVFFLGLLLIILFYYNKCQKWIWLLTIIPIMYLWACLHGSFLIGFAVIFFWLGIKVVEKFLFRYYNKDFLDFSKILEWQEILRSCCLACLAIVATFFTPYGLKLYSFLGGYKDNFYQGHIQEWLSQMNYPFQYRQLIYLALVMLVIIFYIYYCRGSQRKWRINLWTLGVTILFVFLSFKSRRHFPLMFAATFVFLVSIFSRLFEISSQEIKQTKIAFRGNWLKWYLVICLILTAVYQLVSIDFTTNPFASFRKSYPVGATIFLKTQSQYDKLRLFNDYAWGGYLIWELPGRKLFIDGRLPQVKYKNQTFLEEYFSFFKADQNISEKLKQYEIGLIIIPVKDEEIRPKRWEQLLFSLSNKNFLSHNYLRDYLTGSEEWQTIYYDQTAIIYERIK